ncbi:hypothetical protein PISMIDRAFT_681857 [Pisolithus microcarpus 441]|uniref:Uncharacterized protein n=1 Tax=Pisolithus microcarpus 441 TaxID=765257 RepID=A0A0C9Y885_9AGAM|nr:hypothetical protein PISMIDRAFT_681857 [Pisolithus microcarpus 441]
MSGATHSTLAPRRMSLFEHWSRFEARRKSVPSSGGSPLVVIRGPSVLAQRRVTDGALAMRFSAFTFSCNAVVDDYLIFNIKNIKADVGKNNVDVAANQKIIDSIRRQLDHKLDQAAGDYIDSVDI